MDDHLKAFMEHTALADGALKAMICKELQQKIILAEQEEAIQAERVRKAYNELQEARKPLTELESEISFAEANSETWIRRETGEDIGFRVEAPIWQSRWADEIAKLRDRLTVLQTEIQPCEQEYLKQRQSLAIAEQHVKDLKANMLAPFIGYGQETEAYKLYRCGYGSIIRVLVMTNEDNWEWPSAMAWLTSLADMLGYDLTPNTSAKTKKELDALADYYREKTGAPNLPDELLGTPEAGAKGGAEITYNGNAPQKDDYRFGGHRGVPNSAHPEKVIPWKP